MSQMVMSEILRLFVNTLTTDDKYSLCNRENLWQTIQMQLSKKQKTFSRFFPAFLKYAPNFEHFEENMQITWLVKYLKSPVSEHPSTVYTLKCSKQCQNLHDSTFIVLFKHSDTN